MYVTSDDLTGWVILFFVLITALFCYITKIKTDLEIKIDRKDREIKELTQMVQILYKNQLSIIE